jgi:hypothetical protein
MVNRMFAQAATQHITIQQTAIQLTDIARIVSEGNMIILLLDSRYLQCVDCKRPKLTTSTFVGHYIVLCGFTLTDFTFYYMDPARDHGMCQ